MTGQHPPIAQLPEPSDEQVLQWLIDAGYPLHTVISAESPDEAEVCISLRWLKAVAGQAAQWGVCEADALRSKPPKITEQITLEQALELVDFGQGNCGTWYVNVVKGFCFTVKGWCGTVEGTCGSVERGCGAVKGYCGTVGGDCGIVEGDCGIVEGRVLGAINGRHWQYVETSREQVVRLLEEGASKEELLKALEELND